MSSTWTSSYDNKECPNCGSKNTYKFGQPFMIHGMRRPGYDWKCNKCSHEWHEPGE